jgi:hypothetical protein
MPNIDRLKADNMSRTSYQREDFSKKKINEEARIENRRVHSQQILKRIEDKEKVQEQRYAHRLHNKAACNMIYEHVAYL